MALVASLDKLPPRVLPSIATVEGGRVGLVSRNHDGSDDLGVMQVNTRWIPVIARVTHTGADNVRARLLTDACFNISAAGAILRTYLDQEHGNLMQAIGDYHSHTPLLKRSYQLQVLNAAEGLFGATTTASPATPRATPAFSPGASAGVYCVHVTTSPVDKTKPLPVQCVMR
jgi:soluble lytic murein transglycosylase-like protein